MSAPASRFLLAVACCTAAAACRMGPDYQRKDLGTPGRFRFGNDQDVSLGDLDWRSVYRDPALRSLIEEALAASPDLAAAAARIVQAQANLDVVRSQFYPALGAGYSYNQSGSNGGGPAGFDIASGIEVRQNIVGISLLEYELDLWGRIRRASEAARARLCATQEARRTVEVGLVASIAGSYLALCEQDHELAIARRTLASRRKSLDLIRTRQQGGQSALTDVRQAEVLVAEADAAISTIERQIAQLENLLSTLVGRSPGPVRRRPDFLGATLVTDVPAGLPSQLLNRRPDVRSAEQELIAATAEIGAAEARLLPAFTFTAGAGLRAREFSDLFSDPTRIWQIGPAVRVPVFAGGRLLAGIRGSKAARDEAEARYRSTVLTGLREVSDSLVARSRNAEVSAARDRVVKARKDAQDLIWQRYDNGVASYLEVLYNDQELFSAELQSARARLDALNATVQLYRALGGGWDRSTALPSGSSTPARRP